MFYPIAPRNFGPCKFEREKPHFLVSKQAFGGNFSLGRSHLMASLPTSLHFFRKGCGRCDRSHIPAPKWKNSRAGINPTPLKVPEFAGRALRPLWTTCIIGICPGIFFCGAGQRNWTFFSGQPSNDCSITSRVKERDQRRSGILWKVPESQVSPLGCSPPVLDAALLACARTSSAQSFHMDCAMPLAAFAAGCVRAQHALGSGVPRCSMHGCAHTAHAHIIHA